MKVLDLANYIVFKANECKISLDHLKLQKLLYYIQGYTLKEFNIPAFDEEIEHWDHGPVIPIVYTNYSKYGSFPLEVFDDKLINKPNFVLKRISDIIIRISDNYSSRELENMTHLEKPWLETKRNEIISKNSIGNYFQNNNPLDLNLNQSILENEKEYKEFSDQILDRDKDIFEALS